MSLEQNLEYANYGLAECNKRFPLGGLNRKDVFDKLMTESRDKLILQVKLRNQYRLSSTEKLLSNPETYSPIDFTNKLQGAYCGDLANYTAYVIAQKYPDITTEVAQCDGHEFVVINRKKESDPANITTWGDEAVVCDPWAGKMYAVEKFFAMQQQEDVPSYAINNDLTHTLCEKHYLSGKPMIVDKYIRGAKINHDLGRDALKSGMHIKALEHFREAISLYEKTIHEVKGECRECYTYITTCLYVLNKYNEASVVCQHAIKLYETEQEDLPSRAEAIAMLKSSLEVINNEIAQSIPQSSKLSQNLEYANYGLEKCREKFPLGALNRKECFEELTTVSKDFFNQQFMLLKEYRDICIHEILNDSITPENNRKRMQTFELLKGGFCGDLAQFTIAIIREKAGNEVTVELVQTKDHECMVIGRSPDSDRSDITTWGESAVICDPWARLIYPAAEFLNHQKGASILYYHTNQDDFGRICEEHYLIGAPLVVDNSYVSGQRLYDNGREYFLIREFDTAIKLFLRSKEILEKLPYAKLYLAMCCADLSTCYIELKQYKLGVDLYKVVVQCFESEYGLFDDKTQGAKKILKDIQNVVIDTQAPQMLFAVKPTSLVEVKKLYAAGLVHFKNNDFDEAITSLNSSLDQFKKLPNSEEEQGLCYSSLASCYRGTKEYDMAKKMAETAVKFLEAKLGSENEKTINAKTKLTGIERLLTENPNIRRLG